jgi:hypothetical protein
MNKNFKISKKKNFFIIFSLVLFVIIFFLIYNYNSAVLNLRERNLRNKMHSEIEKINYCDVKEDCAIGCIPHPVGSCGKPYLFNKNADNSKVDYYIDKIKIVDSKRLRITSINCFMEFCDEYGIHIPLTSSCEANKCVFEENSYNFQSN